MRFSVFGANGFIGSQTVEYLCQAGHDVVAYERNKLPKPEEHLGHVIYAIGLTGNYRQKPFETVSAHVTELATRMQGASYDSWLYLSSTRVYGTSVTLASEADRICVMPSSDAGIYDISKLLGESLCLALGRPTVRVVRLANVYGVGQSCNTFLGSLLEDVAIGRNIIIREDINSSKDYVAISDVVRLMEMIALHGRHQVYNIASGIATSHRELADVLHKCTGVSVNFLKGAPRRNFPIMNIARVKAEFGFVPKKILGDMASLVTQLNVNKKNGSRND